MLNMRTTMVCSNVGSATPETVTGLVTTEPGPGERIMIASSGRAGGGGPPEVAVGGPGVTAAGGTGEVRTGGAVVFVGGAGTVGPVTTHATETTSAKSKKNRRVALIMVTLP
jgi:hypothetical protein